MKNRENIFLTSRNKSNYDNTFNKKISTSYSKINKDQLIIKNYYQLFNLKKEKILSKIKHLKEKKGNKITKIFTSNKNAKNKNKCWYRKLNLKKPKIIEKNLSIESNSDNEINNMVKMAENNYNKNQIKLKNILKINKFT